MQIEEILEQNKRLTELLNSYKDNLANALPVDIIPDLPWLDIYGESKLFGAEQPNDRSGDHIFFIDFPNRYDLEYRKKSQPQLAEMLDKTKDRLAVGLIDVSGHSPSDSVLAAIVRQNFLMGALRDMTTYGEITATIFDDLNVRTYKSFRAYNSSSFMKFATLLYVEFSKNNTIRYINAGNPPIQVYDGELHDFNENGNSPALGLAITTSHMDSKVNGGFVDAGYHVTEKKIIPGHILLLSTDGLWEHNDNNYYHRIGDILKEVNGESAKVITKTILEDAARYKADDDLSLVVAKYKQ